ncbi:hypothetical protein ABZ942_00515 [Nocardia sp. NPDC046473]|uniref:hypothetical protein n=1 Tax=Nocardia sp. NPDC046473 TaxID=3155733 RepID=UPI0033C7F1F9
MTGLIAPAKVGIVLTAAAPINTVAAAVHMAATRNPSFTERRLKYYKTPGIGEFWTVRALNPGDARRLLADHEPAMAMVIGAGGGLQIQTMFYVAGNGTRVSFLAINHDVNGFLQIASAFWWADTLAKRTAEFLAESDVSSELETKRMRSR